MISGSIVALVTPMDAEGALNWDALDALVDWHLASGTHGIVPVGTTGESATVDVVEHGEIIQRVVDRVDKRVPVIAGTGANATREAIELSQHAQNCGADACLLVTPYYNKPTQDGLYQHYKSISESIDIPQILYNVPARTSCDMLPGTVARLAALPGIIGIKEATGDLQRAVDILELCGADIVVYSGDDATAVDLMLGGASGTISVTANVAPGLMAEVCEAAVSGDSETARTLDKRLRALHDALFVESNPIPVKWALQQMGRIGPGIRLPLTGLSQPFHEQVLSALREAGALN